MKINYIQFIKFCLVGLSSAVVMYTAYFCMLLMCNNYYVANICGFIFSTTNSFLWNRKFVFEKQEDSWKSGFKTYLRSISVYAFTGLIISNILLYIWIDNLNISKWLAPIINIVLITPVNFILNKVWAFHK